MRANRCYPKDLNYRLLVFVCSNMAFSGDFTAVLAKHTFTRNKFCEKLFI